MLYRRHPYQNTAADLVQGFQLCVAVMTRSCTLILKMEMPEMAKWRDRQKPASVMQLPYMPSRPDRQNMPPKACNAARLTLLRAGTGRKQGVHSPARRMQLVSLSGMPEGQDMPSRLQCTFISLVNITQDVSACYNTKLVDITGQQGT